MHLAALILYLIMPDTLSLISIYIPLCLTLCLLLCFLTCCPSVLAVNVYERGLVQCSPQEGDAVLVAGSTELYRRHHSSALLLS